MKLVTSCLSAVVLVLCGSVFSDAQPLNISGRWYHKHAEYYGYWNIVQNGDSFSGTFDDVHEGTYGDKIVDGIISGNIMEFTRDGKYGIQYWRGEIRQQDGHLEIVNGRWRKAGWSHWGNFYASCTRSTRYSWAGRITASIALVDDEAKIFVNGREAVTASWGTGPNGRPTGHQPGYTGDVDVTGYFRVGDNQVRLWLWNQEVCCGVSAVFKLKIGDQIILADTYQDRDSTSGVKFDKTYNVIWAGPESAAPTVAGQSREEGIKLLNEGEDLREKARSIEDLKKAVGKYEEGMKIFQRIGFEQGVGWVANNLGIVYKGWGQHGKAVEHYEKSLGIKRKIGDLKGEAATLNNLAIVYQSSGQYAKAVESYQKSLEIKRDFGDLKGQGTTLSNLGGVYESWGRYVKAAESYEKSLDIFSKIGDVTGEGATLNNLGKLFESWGQYDKAVEFYQRALQIFERIGDAEGEAISVLNLGRICQFLGQHTNALASFQRGLEIYLKMGFPTQWPKRSLGHLYLDVKDFQGAEPLAEESGSWELSGRLSLLKAEYSRGRDCYDRLRQSAEKNRNTGDLFIAYTGLGMSFEGMGEYAASAQYFRKAIETNEEIRAGLSESVRAEFFTVRVGGFFRTDPYEGLARVLAKMNRPIEALKESEQTKARVFAEGLSRRGAETKSDVPDHVIEHDSRLNEQLAALINSLQAAYEKENNDVIEIVEPLMRDARGKLAVHIDMLRREHPLFAATKYPQPMDLSQTALRDNEWSLSYDVTETGVLIYLTQGKTLLKGLFKPVRKKDVEELVRKVREPLEVVPGRDKLLVKLEAFDFESLKKLSDILLGDIVPDLPKGIPVIIVPDECLGIVPFEMLSLAHGGKIDTSREIPTISAAEFFGDRNPITYYQSVTALTLARTLGKRKGLQDKLLVMADPVYGQKEKDERARDTKTDPMATGTEGKLHANVMAAVADGRVGGLRFERLPHTEILARNLTALFHGGCTKRTGLEARKDAFLTEIAPKLDEYNRVLFATHGYFGKDLPGIREPVLVFTLVPPGTDGYLRMSEVMGLRMNADIVALTACQTGMGRELSGEGVMGMGRAFQYAGARSVLMSLWSVHEKCSVQLVERFFKNLKEGKNKLAALKEAREDIRKQGFDHPFFWAAFILVGEVD